jgi:hypothetical protein
VGREVTLPHRPRTDGSVTHRYWPAAPSTTSVPLVCSEHQRVDMPPLSRRVREAALGIGSVLTTTIALPRTQPQLRNFLMSDRAHVHEWGTRVIGALEFQICDCGGRRTRIDPRRLPPAIDSRYPPADAASTTQTARDR